MPKDELESVGIRPIIDEVTKESLIQFTFNRYDGEVSVMQMDKQLARDIRTGLEAVLSGRQKRAITTPKAKAFNKATEQSARNPYSSRDS